MTADAALCALTASDAARAIAGGRITSEALVRACLDRIAEREGEVKAWAHLDPDHAIAQAKAADAALRAGAGVGPLHGVPVGAKDIFDTADFGTEFGSPAFKGRRPATDAVCVAALRAAGAVILGKTITTEFATLTPNVTRNPVNLEHTPGGSSSGSAAAVADNMVPVALGSQTIGSTIRPASFCGVYAMKPTYGLIPCTGVMAHAPSLDTVGLIARSLEDLALMAEVMQGYDARDPATRPASKAPLREIALMEWKIKPMFAFIKTAAWSEADAGMREAIEEVVSILGANVAEVVMDTTVQRGLEAARIIQRTELAHHAGPTLDKSPDLVSPRLAAEIEEGRRITAVEYYAALNRRQELYDNVLSIITDYGALLTPSAPGPAPKGLGATGNPVFNACWTFLGVPCVSAPLLEIGGMPVGLQVVGARGDDGRTLRTARLLVEELSAAAAG